MSITPRPLAARLRASPTLRSLYGAGIAARVIGGYKVIDARRRLGLGARDKEAADRRHHQRSAWRVYHGVVRLQGLMIKIGQTIGSYPAAFPREYIAVLSRLQDAVPPRPWAEMRPALEADLGGPVAEVFAEFDREPVAAASLAQVYRARLMDGRAVAVKVLYPGIERLVRSDLRLLRALLWLNGRAAGFSLASIYQELAHGFFHADPHPGNLLALPGNRLAILDFGLTKRFSEPVRRGMVKVSRATYTLDTENIVEGYRELGFAVRHGDGAEVFLATADFMRALTDPSTYAAGPEAMLTLNRQWEQAARANPFIALPGDLTLASRVLFLLTGVGVGMGAAPRVLESVLRYTSTEGVAARSA